MWREVQLYITLLILQLSSGNGEETPINLRPIIGILAQEFDSEVAQDCGLPPDTNGSYIAASYVKMVESSGARVVPILIGMPDSYYQKMVNSVNGILLPGGDSDLWRKGGYGDTGKIIFELALEMNRRGNQFPLFGVCLGFELLAVASTDMKHVLSPVSGVGNVALPLDFLPKYRRSSLFSKTPTHIIRLLKTNVTANHHSVGLTQESLKRYNLTDTWTAVTTSRTVGEKPFISTMVHAKYPNIFGTQFHPEKPLFEWGTKQTDPHTLDAILSNRWFYDYFVEQARQNTNKFATEDEERASLIYKYQPTYTPKGYFEQVYIFDSQ